MRNSEPSYLLNSMMLGFELTLWLSIKDERNLDGRKRHLATNAKIFVIKLSVMIRFFRFGVAWYYYVKGGVVARIVWAEGEFRSAALDVVMSGNPEGHIICGVFFGYFFCTRKKVSRKMNYARDYA